MSETKAVFISKLRDNTTPMIWFDGDGSRVDGTGYVISGEIDWGASSLDVTSNLSWTTQASGEFQLALTEAQAAALPDGLASVLSVTMTSGTNDYPIVKRHPVYVET